MGRVLSRHATGGRPITSDSSSRLAEKERKKKEKEKEKNEQTPREPVPGSREPTVLGIARYPPRGFRFAPTSSRPYSEFQEVGGRGERGKGREGRKMELTVLMVE